MKKLTYVLAALSAFASFAEAPKLGELTDDSVVPAVSNSAEVVLSGDSISLRNPDAGTGLVISGVGSGIVVTNGATVYTFPERSGTVMLNGDESDPTVPSWAKADNPPASMPDNGLVLTNNGTTVKTKAGTEITASMVGAMPSSYTAPVTSVNTKTGDVTLNAADVGAIPSTKTTWLADDVRSSGGNVFVQTSNTGVQGGGTSKMMFFSGNSIFFKIMSGEAEGGWQNFVFPCYTGGSSKYLATTDTTVPTTRKVNNKPLSSDITLGASDVGAVPATRTVNNKALSSNISLSASDVGAATPGYVDQQNEATRAIVQTWEGFLDGSNVVFSITNYISGSYSLDTAKLRILEMTNGVYREVYNTRDEIVMHITDFKTNDFATATNQVIASVDSKIAGKADKAWGKYTSTGGEAPSNTVVMTETYTKFAGGTEYYRFAVGEGSIAVLATKGAPAYAVGDEGTFKFQDDGGTNYFGFAKSDSYVLGCNADGISVSSGIVTIRYDVVMPNYPCVWYKASLSSATPWEQLNLPDGTAIAGASHAVSWEQNPPEGQKLCYLNCSGEPQGFFKATIEVAGGAKFMTNMPAEFSAGIVCTNTSSNVNGVIVPTYNGSSVIWTWRAQ